jgi:hypothetical protein
MPQVTYTSEEVVQRGEELYQRDLRDQIEDAHKGKFLVLDIETGDYEIDADEVAAVKRAMARRPEGVRYIKRIGYSAAHRLGGRFSVPRRDPGHDSGPVDT